MTEFKFPATLVEGVDKSVVTAFDMGSANSVHMADSFHPHWNAIIRGLEAGDPNVWELFDVATGVVNRFREITDRVSWNGTDVLWDGDPVHSALSEHLSRVIQSGDENAFTATAKFWEKLESNPNAHSREQAFSWLAASQFQITPDGDVVGYKGVYDNGDGTYKSWHASSVAGSPSAFVNGSPVAERIQVPQNIGDVVTMPRSEVKHDPTVSCHRGLHVATRAYATSYGNTVLEVHVNPRDIVSVPNDAHGAKVRACRYYVARIAGLEGDTRPVLTDEPAPVWTGNVGYRVD